jgi:octaprenyl-diphosphate synthase
MDDALDYVANQSEFGKASGHDLLEGKVTLPLIYTLRHCTADERSKVEAIVEQDELPADDLAYVIDLIDRYDGIAFTRQRATELVVSAKAQLACFDESPVKQALDDLADYVVSRTM